MNVQVVEFCNIWVTIVMCWEPATEVVEACWTALFSEFNRHRLGCQNFATCWLLKKHVNRHNRLLV